MTTQVPATAQRLAAELADAFEQDRGLAERLNAPQHCLQAANDRLWSGLHPDALGLVYDGAGAVGQGASAVAEGVGDAVRSGAAAADAEAVVLGELQEVHWTIHRAFSEHQQLGEDRRHLAAEIGELIAQFVAELVAAGWSEDEARQADVHQLAGAVVQ
ncbi:MAG: hypothetical protein M3071_23155 [Actinomycetota bacterium]|nr:hypothetical protein [Actinomycetota bacterium]